MEQKFYLEQDYPTIPVLYYTVSDRGWYELVFSYDPDGEEKDDLYVLSDATGYGVEDAAEHILYDYDVEELYNCDEDDLYEAVCDLYASDGNTKDEQEAIIEFISIIIDNEKINLYKILEEAKADAYENSEAYQDYADGEYLGGGVYDDFEGIY